MGGVRAVEGAVLPLTGPVRVGWKGAVWMGVPALGWCCVERGEGRVGSGRREGRGKKKNTLFDGMNIYLHLFLFLIINDLISCCFLWWNITI